MTAFSIDPQLRTDSLPVGDLRLCALLLMNDRRFPWAILVPRRPGLVEWTDLHKPDQLALLEEINATVAALRALTSAQKTNVAALGNAVRQFHVHVIARFETDLAWPGAVWGRGAPVLYNPGEGEALAAKLAKALNARPPLTPARAR